MTLFYAASPDTKFFSAHDSCLLLPLFQKILIWNLKFKISVKPFIFSSLKNWNLENRKRLNSPLNTCRLNLKTLCRIFAKLLQNSSAKSQIGSQKWSSLIQKEHIATENPVQVVLLPLSKLNRFHQTFGKWWTDLWKAIKMFCGRTGIMHVWHQQF